MQTITHPRSHAPVQGVILGPGAILVSNDLYDSTDGKWRTCQPFAGAIVQAGHGALLVRPVDLSEDSRELLRFIIDRKFLLARDSWHWKMVPSPRWATDGRMDWGLPNQCTAKELLEYGFIRQMDQHKNVYEVTEEGKQYVATLDA